MALDQPVEGGENIVEEFHEIGRRRLACSSGEASHVGEQDRRLIVPIGDDLAGSGFEPIGNDSGEHVGQQRLRPFVLKLGGRFRLTSFANGKKHNREYDGQICRYT